MHVCEGYTEGVECHGPVRKYLVTEMLGSVPTTSFSMALCDDCHVDAEITYGGSPGEDRPYWWRMERCDVATWEHKPGDQLLFSKIELAFDHMMTHRALTNLSGVYLIAH